MSRTDAFPVERLIELTENGRDIFAYELNGIPKKNIKSPLRTGDDVPSFQVKETKAGKWVAVDHNGTFKGNAIEFVQARYSLTFPQAIEKIVQDLGLREKTVTYIPKIIQEEETEKEEFQPLLIEFMDMPFTPAHHEYFNRGHLTEDFLKTKHVYAVKKWAIEKQIQKIKPDEIVFAYYAEDIDRTKILRIGPTVSKKDKWRSGVENTHIWDLFRWEGKHVEDLFVIKSRKDQLVVDLLGYATTSVQNESSAIFLNAWGEYPSNADKLLKICNKPIINFGTDEQGKKESILITEAIGCRWFNTQNSLLKMGITDNFEFVSEFDLKTLDRLLELKGFKKLNYVS